MTDTFEFTLNNPLTEEQWDMIADVDFDHTDRIWFHTKHGKEVEFTKVRHGHWVGIDDDPCEVWECDVCGYIYETDSKLHRYCPNCGADMRGEDSEHE